jgi:hypothetical protein
MRSSGGFEGVSPLSHMNRHNMNTPEKTKTNQTIERKNPCKLINQ